MKRAICAFGMLWPLLAGCGGGSSTSSTSSIAAPNAPASAPQSADVGCSEADFREHALAAINQRRAAGAQCGSNGSFPGAAALGWSDALAQAAFGHSKDMAERNYFAHESPEDGSLSMRVDATGYAWSSIGENIAKGPASAGAVVDLWMASPGHCKNIMTAGFRQIGMACAQNAGGTSQRYYTLDLAAPR